MTEIFAFMSSHILLAHDKLSILLLLLSCEATLGFLVYTWAGKGCNGFTGCSNWITR